MSTLIVLIDVYAFNNEFFLKSLRYQEQKVAGTYIDSVYKDEAICGPIQTDMMIEFCAAAIIHGRYVNNPVPELIDKCRNETGTHRSPACVTNFLVKGFY